MKFLICIILITTSFSSFALNYNCKASGVSDRLNISVKMKPRLEITKATWGNLFKGNYEESSSLLDYKDGIINLIYGVAGDDSLHLILSSKNYKSLRRGEKVFRALGLTKNSRGFIYVSGKRLNCIRK